MRARCCLLLTVLAAACGGEAGAAPEAEASEAVPAEGEAAVAEDEPDEEVAAAPTPVIPTAHDVLFLVTHEAPLLPSEERQLGVLEERLRRRHLDVERREATDAEVALAQSALDGEAGAALPPTFGRASRVVIMRVAAPRTRSDGDLVSRGVSGVLLFRPPLTEPSFEARLDEASSWRLTDDQWSSWLAGLLRDAEGS